MNDNELKSLWKAANEKWEATIAINKQNIEDIAKMKVQNFLSSMKPTKIFALIVGLLWVLVLGAFILYLFVNAYTKVSLYFLYSATIQVLLTAIAVLMYIHQLYLISNIDFSESVLHIQETISKLKISTLDATRILFLQLPVWTTFYLSNSMFETAELPLLIFQGIVTLSFTFVAIWLFVNIKYENRHKKWFQLIFRGKAWQPILKAMDLMEKLQQFGG